MSSDRKDQKRFYHREKLQTIHHTTPPHTDIPSLKVLCISFSSAAALPTSLDSDLSVSGPKSTRATTSVMAISAVVDLEVEVDGKMERWRDRSGGRWRDENGDGDGDLEVNVDFEILGLRYGELRFGSEGGRS